MKIAFPVFYKDSHNHKTTGVWGDEMAMRGQAEFLKQNGIDADLYIKEEMTKYDICVYSSHQNIHPHRLREFAPFNILWIQGFTYDQGSIVPLDLLYDSCKEYYDLVITSSKVLSEKRNIPFILPFNGLEPYHRVETKEDYDISFIGNILKPFEQNIKYLRPLYNYKYGVFGGDFGKVSHEKALEIISGSKINLSYGFEESIKWDMVIARPFYHSLCKSFTLMDKVPWYMKTFGETIGYTEGGDDEIEKLKYYIGNEEMRNLMATEAFNIAKSIKNDTLLKLIKGV